MVSKEGSRTRLAFAVVRITRNFLPKIEDRGASGLQNWLHGSATHHFEERLADTDSLSGALDTCPNKKADVNDEKLVELRMAKR